MRAIGAAVIRLAENPYPPEAFHRGDYHRLRVGLYRVVYIVDKTCCMRRLSRSRHPRRRWGHLLGAVQPVSMAGMPVGTVLAGIAVQALGVLPTNAGMGVISLDK
jgi:hypothetical protein